jgi:ornithine decarboxylase
VIRLAVSNAESDRPLSGKFGIEVGAARDLLVTAKRLGLRCSGATFHVGSQCTNARAWLPAIDLARVLFRMGQELGHPMDLLNLGGGYPATYLRRVPSARQIEAAVAPYLRGHFPSGTRFFVEPGRYLVGDAGVFVTSVIGKAWRSDGRLWVHLDIGVFNGLAEALGGIRYPVLTGREGPVRPVTLAGVSCDGFDIIDTRAEYPEPEIGDRWLLLTAGAYTTVYAARFNGLDLPKVAFLEDLLSSRLL